MSIDYDPRAFISQEFFKKVQNKIHYAIHGRTAAELIVERADAEKDFMGLLTFKGHQPTLVEAKTAKNHLRILGEHRYVVEADAKGESEFLLKYLAEDIKQIPSTMSIAR